MRKAILFFITILFLIYDHQVVFAHDGEPPQPHDLWTSWNWDPVMLLPLMFMAWMQITNLKKRRSDINLNWRNISFMGGWIALFVALVSPLDAMSGALFSAHMIQHTILLVVAPPLLVFGMFIHDLNPDLQRSLFGWMSRLKSIWRVLLQPSVAWGLNVLTLWLWHVPAFYQKALENENLHMFEHFCFIGTSLLFWWVITRPRMRSGQRDPGILSLFTMAMQSGFLGALITFAPTPWYTAYTSTTKAWGLSPLEDQQLAGAIMWIPMGMIYTVAALVMFFNHLAWLEHTSHQREEQTSRS
jgi:putative membrane protein